MFSEEIPTPRVCQDVDLKKSIIFCRKDLLEVASECLNDNRDITNTDLVEARSPETITRRTVQFIAKRPSTTRSAAKARGKIQMKTLTPRLP